MTSVWSFRWFQCQLNIVNAIRMPHMIRMSFKRLNCVTLIHCLSTFWNFTIMASLSTKHQAENKSYKSIRHSKNSKRKKLSIRILLPFSECQKTTWSTWKKNKDKIFEKYKSGLKPCINDSSFYEVKMFQSVANAQRKGCQIRRRIEHWGISSFRGTARKMEKDIKYAFLYISTYILKTSQIFTELFLENFN